MSTDVTPNSAPTAKIAPTEQQASQAGVPKQIVNAQTVCNEKNEKGKLCNGHLKQLRTGGEEAEVHSRGDDVLFKCQSCGTLYVGPPLGHVRDPQKQRRVVETELAALLQAAGGSLPAFKKSATGAWIPLNEPESHAPAAKPASAGAKPAATAKPAVAKSSTDASAAPKPSAPRAASTGKGIPPPPAHLAPPADETPEQKRARLARIVAEAKARAGKEVPPAIAAAAASAPPTPARTTPTAATTSGTDSSPSADAHRPAAEAQAATGQASAAPLSPAAATASPAAGAESVADLAPDASTELTPGAPPATPTASTSSAPKPPAPRAASSSGGKGIPPPPAHLAPPAGETHEEKIARLRRVVEEAKARAGK
jgi:hypothetical protein